MTERVITWWGFGQEWEAGTMSWRSAAPSPSSGQAGARQERASPAPRGVGRGGKERGGDRKGRVAPGEGHTRRGERPAPPGRLCPSAAPRVGAWDGGKQHGLESGPE